MKFDPRRDTRRLLTILLAAAIGAFNIKSFVNSAGLFPGGVSGLTILLQSVADKYLGIALPFTPVNLLLNAVPVYIAWRFVGHKFTLLSCFYLVLNSVLVDLIPGVTVTENQLLLSVFGGIIAGFAGSLCFNADTSTGGTDLVTIYLSEKRGYDAFNLIFGCNCAMLCVAGLLFGWERALYSIIFQFAATQTVQALFTKYQKQTLFIITEKPDRVYDVIRSETHHAATLFKGEGLYNRQERSMVYSVVSRQEAQEVIKKVRGADENAFVNSIRTQSLTGRFYNRPND